MRYHERLNIIFMRDNGPRRSFRIRRSRLYLLILFFSCLPFLCAALAVQVWFLWDVNQKLRDNVEKFETDYQKAVARAERLENLEILLEEESVPGKDIIMRQLAANAEKVETEKSDSPESPELVEGPGHEEFPGIDSGRVKVSNVQVRAMRGNILRIGLDLRNPDTDQLLSGEVGATLVTAAGEKKELTFMPQDVGNFRISRFKRTVMSSHIPRNINLADSQIILEVKDQSGKELYRNIFSVQR